MTAIRHFRKERKKAENSSSLESVLYKFTLPSVPKRGREEEHIDPPAWRVSTQAPARPARAGLSVDGIIFTMIPSLVSSVAARVPAAYFCVRVLDLKILGIGISMPAGMISAILICAWFYCWCESAIK